MKKSLLCNVVGFVIMFFTASLYSAEENLKVEEKNEKPWYETLKLTGALRIRPELKSNIGFVSGGQNTSEYISQKAWVSLTANPIKNLKVGLTLQDSRIWGSETNSNNGLSTPFLNPGFREAYMDLALLPDSQLHITAGRQKIAFGDERLFGNLEWSNVGRSFDAIKIQWDTSKNTLNLWGSLLQDSNAIDAPLVSVFSGQSELYLLGVYDTLKIAEFLAVDVYYAHKMDLTDSTTLRHNTIGVRITDRTLKRKTPENIPLDFTAEGAYQFGIKNSKDVSAYAAALAIGYTLNPGIKIRIGAEGDVASGDSNATDNKIETFDNLFPTNHAFYGQADMISWQNMIAASGNLSFIFAKEFNVKVAYWYLSRMVSTDSWYAVTGGSNKSDSFITSSSGVSNANLLAHELDLTLKSEINKYLTLEAGYSLVLPADAVIEAGKTDPYHFAYVYAMLKF